jgi:hypothetical protein
MIAKLQPYFCRTPHSDEALEIIGDFIRSLLSINCGDSSQFGRQIRQSKEWLALAKALAEESPAAAESKAPEEPAAALSVAQDPSPAPKKSEQVDKFLRRLGCNKNELCMVASVDQADFRRWQRDDPHTPRATAGRIEGVLKMEREEFLRVLKQRAGH